MTAAAAMIRNGLIGTCPRRCTPTSCLALA
jgi:hypothetical protein